MKKTYLLALSMGLSMASFAQRTLIHCGTLIDGISNSPKNQMTIIVEKNRITDVQSGYAIAQATDKVVDMKTKTVTPGWIDMHVHIESETSKDQYLKRMSYNMADIAFEAQKHANTTLMAGFTTVRDCGGSGVNISLRNAINKGLVVGPRIFTSGKTIATTGGHGDPSNGISSKYTMPDESLDGVVNSPEEGRQAVRQRYKDGADCIKITATGGVLSVAKNGKGPQFTESEIEAIVSTAKDYGFIVAAHAHGAEGMKRAIRAGVTTIEHGSFMDDEAIELFKKYGTYYVPTIIAGKSVLDSVKVPGYYHPLVVPKILETGKQTAITFAKAYKAGVKVAFGTDAGVFPHGYNAKEFMYMVEGGMPMMEAIKSATIVNAEILGMKTDLGSIEKGKLADIVAIDGDPLQDAKAMMNVVLVMKEGKIYKQK
ncbi:amidohydrolase family protein [Emticicia sp.]|uniref:amidohydrolase family protein n=1 Tax=Emticicia sp. TaxID=1930953 RepID=UPI00375351E0